MKTTPQIIARALAKRASPLPGQQKTAARRWLEDHQLTKLCRLCRESAKKGAKP